VTDGQIAADEIEIGRVRRRSLTRDVRREHVGQHRIGRVGRLDGRDAVVIEGAQVADMPRRVGGDVRELTVLPRVERTDQRHRVAGRARR